MRPRSSDTSTVDTGTVPILRIPLLDVAQLFSQPLEVVKSKQAAEEAVQDEPLLQRGQRFCSEPIGFTTYRHALHRTFSRCALPVASGAHNTVLQETSLQKLFGGYSLEIALYLLNGIQDMPQVNCVILLHITPPVLFPHKDGYKGLVRFR